jgi:altronate hydrolase
LVLFTTGRGTPFGGPVPTVKVSSNSRIFKQKSNWIDFNAGELIEDRDMDSMAAEFFDYLIKVASKKIKTKNEINNYREIAVFKDGVTL